LTIHTTCEDFNKEQLSMRITRRKFDELVFQCWNKIVRSLPSDLRDVSKNIIVSTSDMPLEQDNDSDDDILGIFEGTPLNDRSTMQVVSGHDRIMLFRIPLASQCTTIKILKKEIRLTLIHELGHYLGYDEQELANRGLD
jgi:predicted Zn-dependent protease with MMP-like domain